MREVIVSLQLEELEDGGYVATSNEVPGLVAQGRTVAETVEIAQDVARKLVESWLEHGEELPPALAGEAPARVEVQIPINIG